MHKLYENNMRRIVIQVHLTIFDLLAHFINVF